MKKVNKIFNIIFGYIILVTLIGIGMSYLTDYLVSIEWFGDYTKTKYYTSGVGSYEREYLGARHMWYNAGLWLVSITTFARAFITIVNIVADDS